MGRFIIFIRLKGDLEKLPNRDAVSTELGRSQLARRLVRLEKVLRDASVLIVNDVPAEMSYVIDVLTKLGIDVQIETSTNDALRALSQNSYHVVISDM